MNDDQELTVGDVADLVSTINEKKAVRRISLLQANNSAIVGSWQSAQGQSYQLTASVTPPDAAITAVTWESSNPDVVYVSKSGKVMAVEYGTATITCSVTDGSGVVGTCVVTVSKPHEYVDLGLPSGIKWATCNVGADNPEDYGDYYAWGETETKSTYNWGTYKWMESGYSDWKHVNKYTYPDNQTSGIWYNNGKFVGDNKTTLDPEDDVAHVKWGGDWRMPTKAEQDELRNTNNCTWTWTAQGGKNGYLVTSKKNGNSIFPPAAGYRSISDLDNAGSRGGYWSSSLYTSYSVDAYRLDFNSSYVDWYRNGRYYGFTVRPVCP